MCGCRTRFGCGKVSAPHVVGIAMSRCEERNAMSDFYFASRLQVLIDSGRIEANGPRHRLREYTVRLVQA